MTNIPDFTEAEQKRVAAILFERYGKFVPAQLAERTATRRLPGPEPSGRST